MVNPKFEPTEREERVLEVLKDEHRANPYLIRNETGIGKGDVNTALTRLTSAGWVRKVTRGLYEYVDDPRGEGGAEPAGAPTGSMADSGEIDEQPPEPEPTGANREQTRRSDERTEEVKETLRKNLPGEGDLLEARVGEILKMYDELVERGEAEKSDFLEVVDVGAAGYASEDSVWSNMVKGRDTLRALPGVETPPTGQTTWRYTGERADGS